MGESGEPGGLAEAGALLAPPRQFLANDTRELNRSRHRKAIELSTCFHVP